MSDHHHDEHDPDDVGRLLREHRRVPSDLELDEIKRRALGAAGSGGRSRGWSRRLITALATLGLVSGGTGAVLAAKGVQQDSKVSAAAAQYQNPSGSGVGTSGTGDSGGSDIGGDDGDDRGGRGDRDRGDDRRGGGRRGGGTPGGGGPGGGGGGGAGAGAGGGAADGDDTAGGGTTTVEDTDCAAAAYEEDEDAPRDPAFRDLDFDEETCDVIGRARKDVRARITVFEIICDEDGDCRRERVRAIRRTECEDGVCREVLVSRFIRSFEEGEDFRIALVLGTGEYEVVFRPLDPEGPPTRLRLDAVV